MSPLALLGQVVSPGYTWFEERLTCVTHGAGAVVAKGLGVAGPSVGTGVETQPQICVTLWSCPTPITHT